jgi:cation:H+ antiporter
MHWAVAIVLGLVLLVVGAEWLVRGASKLAARLRISRLIIGLTIVAYGTSSPEMAVSVLASLRGQTDLALGNVVGSNIFNVLLILGLSAIVAPLAVSMQLVRVDVPIMIAVSCTALLMALDGAVGRIDGALLFAGAVGYTLWCVRLAKREPAPADPAGDTERSKVFPSVALVVVSLVLLVAGSRWLLEGSISLARLLGVSELVIGLTVVAAGTSLPELATSVVAAIRREMDISIGNVVGSNIFNLLGVLGASALIAEVEVSPAALGFDIPVMVVVALACLPIFKSGGRIDRWEGALFVGFYAAYALFLFLKASSDPTLPLFRSVMFLFVIPLTAITLLVMFVQSRSNLPVDADNR